MGLQRVRHDLATEQTSPDMLIPLLSHTSNHKDLFKGHASGALGFLIQKSESQREKSACKQNSCYKTQAQDKVKYIPKYLQMHTRNIGVF